MLLARVIRLDLRSLPVAAFHISRRCTDPIQPHNASRPPWIAIKMMIMMMMIMMILWFLTIEPKITRRSVPSSPGRSFFTFLHCVCSYDSSKRLHKRKQSYIGSIYLTFLQYASSNVSSNGLPEKRHIHIGCICLPFLHCVFWNVFSIFQPEKRYSHICGICLAFLHCAFSNVASKRLHE